MKLLRVQALQLGFVILFVIMSVCFLNKSENPVEASYYKSFDEGWSVTVAGETTDWRELPEQLDIDETGQVILEKDLNCPISNQDYLGFYTSHLQMEVFVGNIRIYDLKPGKHSYSKTPGNTWNFVNLTKGCEGQKLQIVLKSVYGNKEIKTPSFYYGTKDSIIMWKIKQNAVSFLLSVIMFLIGAALVCCWVFVGKKLLLNDGIPWLGIMAIVLSVWSAMECQIFPLFMGRPLLFSQITFMSLKMLPLPILQFIGIIYDMRPNKGLKLLCIASCADFWGTMILQMTGIFDFKETLFVTHIICLLSIMYFFVLTIKVLIEKGGRSAKSRSTVVVNAVCIGIMAVSVVLDIVNFYVMKGMDSAKFSRVGLLIYILALTYLLLDDSIRLIRAGQQAQELQRQAETDAMTKLKNRMSFEKDLYKISKNHYNEYGIIICDLNNLKKFNDSYGHSMGDYYIIICSEILQDIFGRHGNVYRIGGDEFCGILEKLEEQTVKELQAEMNQRIHSLSGRQFEVEMAIALGYASYNPQQDHNLTDTMKRADQIMYKNKNGMKA